MQTKILDFESKIEKEEINLKLKYLFIGIVIVLISVFLANVLFAETTEPNLSNIDLTFEKETYSLMDGTSTRVGFTIANNNPVTAQILVWADCEDEDNELECNYSRQFTLLSNSTITSSFNLTAIDESDSTLTVYVKLLNSEEQDIEEYTTDIEVTEDEEDGDFSVDLYDYSLCIGKTNKISLDIENDYKDDLYYLYLSNPRLAIASKYSNPVYIRDEKTIDYYVSVPEDSEAGEAFDLSLRIENNDIKIVKEISVYASSCPEANVDFTVNGPSVVSYTLNKEQEKTVTYTIKNNSGNTKTLYISEEHTNQDIDVRISSLQLTIAPGQTKSVDFTFKALTNIASGSYDINLNFFDGINNVNKKVRLLVNPNYNFQIQSMNNIDSTLVIGQNLEIIVLLKNTGDLPDDFTVTTQADNDLRTRTITNSFTISPHSTVPINIIVSAGANTEVGLSRVYVNIDGDNSNFHNELLYNVNVIRDIAIINLELLSYPTSITIDQNTTKDFEITLKNTGSSNLTINSINFLDVPQDVVLIVEPKITISPGQTKTISARLNIGDIPEEQINARLVFTSSKGGILEKPIILKFQDTAENNTPDKSKLTGYLTLRNSIFLGIIVICLLIILLFATGIIKSNKRKQL